MLKQMFALSDQGSKDLNKGIAATTLSNLCLIAPVSLLVMVIWELLNVISTGNQYARACDVVHSGYSADVYYCISDSMASV